MATYSRPSFTTRSMIESSNNMSEGPLFKTGGKSLLTSILALGTDSPANFHLPDGFVRVAIDGFKAFTADFDAAAYVNPQTGELVVAYCDWGNKANSLLPQRALVHQEEHGQFADASNFLKRAQRSAAEIIQTCSKEGSIARAGAYPLLASHVLRDLLLRP